MSAIILPRRTFLAGLVGIIAAPAIVKATSLMPVRSWIEFPEPMELWSVSEHYPFGNLDGYLAGMSRFSAVHATASEIEEMRRRCEARGTGFLAMRYGEAVRRAVDAMFKDKLT